MSDTPDTKPLFWINPDDVTLPAESNMIYVTSSDFDRNTLPVYPRSNTRKEIEDLRVSNDKLFAEAANERILRYAAEAERDAETGRCAKIAREFQLSPIVGKAIAALIVNGAIK